MSNSEDNCSKGGSEMDFPNLFIVGAPRSGTTSLYQYLAAHPNVFMSPEKEPHFFGSDMQSTWFVRNRQEYLNLFKQRRSEFYAGEASALYLYSQRAAQEIHAFNPDSRIIIMLRSPVEMMQSMYFHSLKTLNEDLPTFEAALDAEGERVQGRQIPSTTFFVDSIFYRRIARYSEQVARYLEIFGQQQVHTIIFDDFRSNTALSYKQTLNFLKIDDTFAPSFNQTNASESIRSKMIARILVNPSARARGLAHRFKPLVYPVYIGLLRFNNRPLARPPLDPELERRLKREFAPEVERLSKLLNRDLTYWTRTD